MRESRQRDVDGQLSRRTFLAGVAAGAVGMVGGGDPEGTDRIQWDRDPATGRARELLSPHAIAKRPFGTTGVDISIVGFGAGSRFYSSIPSDEQAAELLRRAIDMGIELVETSANYGPDGVSEKRIGLAMKTHRSRVFLETKVDERGYDGAMREMERSLQRMNTDRLDLVLHHVLGMDDIEEVAGARGAERALRRMIDEKVVRFRGFSTHTPDAALAGMERLDPQAVQLPINATRVPDFEAEVLPEAAVRGVAVIAMKVNGHGYFHPANATIPDRIEQFGPPPGTLERWDLPTYREYTHYALTLPIATATIGIDSHSTLDGVVANARDFEPLSPQQMASIRERAQVFTGTGYWLPRER